MVDQNIILHSTSKSMVRSHYQGGLRSVQAARGLAALMVVAFHTGQITALPKYWNTKTYAELFSFGSYGVHFFFVLSGFIILWAHSKDIGKPRRLGKYIKKRAMRIYPLYWIVSLLTLLAQGFIKSEGGMASADAGLLIHSFTLLGGGTSILAVGWTLFHEIVFYALFGFFILNRRVGWAIAVIWAAVCLMAPSILSYATDPINLLFIVGLIGALILQRWPIPIPGVLLLAGLVIFVVATRVLDGESILLGAYGTASLLLLLGGIGIERIYPHSIPQPFVWLGDASYSIYLVHFLVLSASAKILVSMSTPASLSVFLMIAMSVMGGMAFYLIVELKVLEWARNKSKT